MSFTFRLASGEDVQVPTDQVRRFTSLYDDSEFDQGEHLVDLSNCNTITITLEHINTLCALGDGVVGLDRTNYHALVVLLDFFRSPHRIYENAVHASINHSTPIVTVIIENSDGSEVWTHNIKFVGFGPFYYIEENDDADYTRYTIRGMLNIALRSTALTQSNQSFRGVYVEKEDIVKIRHGINTSIGRYLKSCIADNIENLSIRILQFFGRAGHAFIFCEDGLIKDEDDEDENVDVLNPLCIDWDALLVDGPHFLTPFSATLVQDLAFKARQSHNEYISNGITIADLNSYLCAHHIETIHPPNNYSIIRLRLDTTEITVKTRTTKTAVKTSSGLPPQFEKVTRMY